MLVLPGYGAGDASTAVLRTHLATLGHPVHRWRLGRNEGPSAEIADGLTERFGELSARHRRPIALVGWSLGGVFACALAAHAPAEVHCIVTLGSPLRGRDRQVPPEVPLTSIWSRRDGVVAWQDSTVEPGGGREDVEVHGNHLTLGFDPLVATVVADRLGQPDDTWEPFRPTRWLAAAYPGGAVSS